MIFAAHACCTCKYITGVEYRPGLSNKHHHTVVHSSLQLSAHRCVFRSYLLGDSSLQVWQLSPRMLSIDAPAVRP